ncbi:eCIS core domain-containing protein [Nannocystis pusilla]|uniref:eCIS core domain-containing protein n=1 Tax=Nannocystis pusilla TaxID=889268 RepID=UPI003DA32754
MPAGHVQRSEASASPPVTPQIARELQRQVLRGRPLESATRQFMESRFAAKLPQVRVHDDGQAATLSQRLGARAFTWQNHIFFNRGEFSPDRPRGRRLIAHELSHVIQQSVPSERATIRRAVKFYDGVEDVRTKVVEEGGEISESSPLIDEFIEGLKKFFQIEAVKRESESGLHAAHAYIAVELAGEAPQLKEEALDGRIKEVFNGRNQLVVPRPRGPGESLAGVKVEDDYAAIDKAALKERYLFVRDALIQRLKKGGLERRCQAVDDGQRESDRHPLRGSARAFRRTDRGHAGGVPQHQDPQEERMERLLDPGPRDPARRRPRRR